MVYSKHIRLQLTIIDYDPRWALVTMSYELLESLLRDDLTPAERYLDQFRFVATLLHELAVG